MVLLRSRALARVSPVELDASTAAATPVQGGRRGSQGPRARTQAASPQQERAPAASTDSLIAGQLPCDLVAGAHNRRQPPAVVPPLQRAKDKGSALDDDALVSPWPSCSSGASLQQGASLGRLFGSWHEERSGGGRGSGAGGDADARHAGTPHGRGREYPTDRESMAATQATGGRAGEEASCSLQRQAHGGEGVEEHGPEARKQQASMATSGSKDKVGAVLLHPRLCLRCPLVDAASQRPHNRVASINCKPADCRCAHDARDGRWPRRCLARPCAAGRDERRVALLLMRHEA